MSKSSKKKARATNLIVLLLVISIDLVFIGRFLIENNQWIFAYFISLLVISSLALGYCRAIPSFSQLHGSIRPRHKNGKAKKNLSISDWLSIFSCMLGAICTYILSVRIGLGAVLGAAIVGTLSSFIPDINKENEVLKTLPFAIYCGAFVGMTANFIFNDISLILISSLITGFIYVASKNVLIAVGGRLGTFAFMGVCLVYAIIKYILQ